MSKLLPKLVLSGGKNMFTAIKAALRPTLGNIMTGAELAIGATIGLSLMRGIGSVASSLYDKTKDISAERKSTRKKVVDIHEETSAQAS